MHRLPCPIVFWWFLLLVAASLLGCPGGGGGGDDDDSGAAGCAPSEGEWAVDPDGADGQIHPESRVIEGRLWTAYNRPDGGSNFAVFVVVRDCDGALVSGPTRLDAGDGNATDPTLAGFDGRVLVAWQTDDGGDPNLSVRTAVLDTDGGVVSMDTRLAMTDAGQPWSGQAWMAHAVGTEAGWALALVRADPEAQFHIAVQRLDRDGLVTEDAIRVTDGAQGAFEPTIIDYPPFVVVGWQKSFDGSQGFGVARVTDAAEPISWPMLDPSGAGIAFARDGAGTMFGAVGNGGARIVFGEVGEDGGEPSGVSAIHSGPRIAPRSPGGVVAWNEGPATNATLALRSFDGDGAFVSERVEVASGVGAYVSDVVALDDRFVAATVADGPSPAFRLRTVVLELP